MALVTGGLISPHHIVIVLSVPLESGQNQTCIESVNGAKWGHDHL